MTSKERKPGVKAMNIRDAILNRNELLSGSRELAKMAITPVNPARPIENSQMMPSGSMMLDMTTNVGVQRPAEGAALSRKQKG